MLAFICLCTVTIKMISALIISPPSSAGDYRQLASLLASSFDAPAGQSSKIELLKWNMLEKSLTEEFIYKQYVSTMRRMSGKKYQLLVAKEYDEDEDGNLRVGDDIVGMIEMGLSPCPALDGNDDDTDYPELLLRPQPTIGVICVKSTHQKNGIGQALVHKCEYVASQVWNEECIFVDVEPDNNRALEFFETCGYDVNELGGIGTRNATVVRRRAAESKPHILLRKKFN